MRLACLLPAAGASTRMRGGDKLLELVDGKPCLSAMAERALAADMHVLVTLPSAEHPRAKAIKHLPVQQVITPNARVGMSASLAAGALAMPKEAAGLMVLPADMPAISSDDIGEMGALFLIHGDCILQAQSKSGAMGHPIIFPRDITLGLWHLTGDRGAQPILERNAERMKTASFGDDSPLQDLDTPEDWAAWRASLARRERL